MTPIRKAVIALALCACSALAQEPSKGKLTVVVTDRSGAVFPGARIAVTMAMTGMPVEATTDASGQAVLHLAQGSYELKVQAKGFESWEESKVEVTSETQRAVVLRVASTGCPISVQAPEIPLERQALAAEIPLVPMQQFAPTARRPRHRPHWF